MATSRFQKLLVPLDGSPLAEQAIPAACGLARRAGGAVHLAVVQPPPLRHLHVSAELAKPVEREAREQLESYLAKQAEAVSMCHGLEATCAVLEGDPAGALAAYARTNAMDLIVMTTHGRGGLGRFWLGSVADSLLRRITSPVLLLRSEKQPQPTDFRHVLVALDGSEAGEAVLAPALALASLYHGARCSLVQVVEPSVAVPWDLTVSPTEVDAALIEQERARATRNLERHAAQAAALGIAATTLVPVVPGIGAQIVGLAEKLDSDVIAVGTRGRHGLERLLLGSVADKVIRGATRPVLVGPIGGHAA
jgi:nucleotide-binding universal stress UspA family protein